MRLLMVSSSRVCVTQSGGPCSGSRLIRSSMVFPLLAGAFGVCGAHLAIAPGHRSVDSGRGMGKCGAVVPLVIVSSGVGHFS